VAVLLAHHMHHAEPCAVQCIAHRVHKPSAEGEELSDCRIRDESPQLLLISHAVSCMVLAMATIQRRHTDAAVCIREAVAQRRACWGGVHGRRAMGKHSHARN
jgi:hypothetical protein